MMTVLSLIIAIVALVIAILAFQRSEWVRDLRKYMASVLAKMEKTIGEEGTRGEK